MPDEPEQTQIPTARASAFNGSLPPPGKSDTMDELMCTVRVPSGTRHASYCRFYPVPGSGRIADRLLLYITDSMSGWVNHNVRPRKLSRSSLWGDVELSQNLSWDLRVGSVRASWRSSGLRGADHCPLGAGRRAAPCPPAGCRRGDGCLRFRGRGSPARGTARTAPGCS